MTIVIIPGGEPLPSSLLGEIPADAYLIAADSGLDHARAHGLDVDLVIGDMDSVTPAALAGTRARIERHPPDKDATDLELALQAARDEGPDRIIVLGGHGGRLDHLLASILLLVSDRWAGTDLEWVTPQARLRPIRGGATLHGAAGRVLTLLAADGPAVGITTSGLRWNLDRATLLPGSTRGVSNEFTGPVATITVAEGTLVAIQPDPA